MNHEFCHLRFVGDFLPWQNDRCFSHTLDLRRLNTKYLPTFYFLNGWDNFLLFLFPSRHGKSKKMIISHFHLNYFIVQNKITHHLGRMSVIRKFAATSPPVEALKFILIQFFPSSPNFCQNETADNFSCMEGFERGHVINGLTL